MLRFSAALDDQIKEWMMVCYPYEGCGLLLGEASDAGNLVQAIFPISNQWAIEDEKRQRFLITPQAMLQAELAALSQGVDVVGIFHSHPGYPAIPSPHDLAWASWMGYSYLIIQVNEKVPALSRSWQLLADRSGFVEEPIEIQ